MKVAKAKGHSRGKQPKLNQRQEAHLVALLDGGQYSTAELADLFGVARSTVYRAVDREPARAGAGVIGTIVAQQVVCGVPLAAPTRDTQPPLGVGDFRNRSWFGYRHKLSDVLKRGCPGGEAAAMSRLTAATANCAWPVVPASAKRR